MKKFSLFIILILTAAFAYSQKSIDQLFEKYAGKDGFTTVTINGSLLKMAHCLDKDDDGNSMPADITEIRILAQDKDEMNVENFYNLVIKDIDLNKYEEFMRVKEADQDLRMLVRTDGNKFKEFLLIAGGSDNAVIQIRGNMTFDEAKKFSSNVGKDHGMNFYANHK
jgi:hypothetical protein